MKPEQIILAEYTRIEGLIPDSVYGAVLYEGKLAGLAYALGALGVALPAEPDPFAEEMVDKVLDAFTGITGADAVGADPSHDFVANGGGR